jgi:cholera toxin transcriptional activator
MPLYRFDGFEFDSVTGELVKGGRRVRLRPQPARVLEHLLIRQGELVTREELRRAIWPDGTYVHFDHGLNSCIKQIRAALVGRTSAVRSAGSAGPVGYIETLVKRGFRFIAPDPSFIAPDPSLDHTDLPKLTELRGPQPDEGFRIPRRAAPF